jgi:hypothetical protein
MSREIEWLVDRLLEEYPHLLEKTVQNHPEMTARDWLKARIQWGIPLGFAYWWGDERGTYGGIIIRPVTEELIVAGMYNYWDTIFNYDLQGPICWIDYAYGPGLYPKMIALCRSTGCPQLGWRHRDRMHIRPMERMPAKAMKMAFHI